MSDYRFQLSSGAEVDRRKSEYLNQVSSPLDGMWESGFLPQADHYLIFIGDQEVGHCAINPESFLLQYGEDESGRSGFKHCLDQFKVKGAFVSTCEPSYLSLCLDCQQSVSVNSVMYREVDGSAIESSIFPDGIECRTLVSSELQSAVEFGVVTLGANEEWLRSYFSRLIDRRELFGCWREMSLIATGECRCSLSQPSFADVGMVVGKAFRNRGLAPMILKRMRKQARSLGVNAICSTEEGNPAARKSIERAGFVGYHRILEIGF
jgi:GNAT superfamily N-acetyltransferase